MWLEDALTPHGLGDFARFVAWAEAAIGALLFSRRFAVVGAIMLVPMVVNILAVTTSMDWRGTPYVVSGFLAFNLWLLFYERNRLWPLVTDGTAPAVRFGPWGHDAPAVLGTILVLAGVPVYALAGWAGYATIAAGFLLLCMTPVWRRARERSTRLRR